MNQWNLELARLAKQVLFDALGFVLLFGAFLGLSFKFEYWPKIACVVVVGFLLLFCGNGFAIWLASPLIKSSEKWAALSYENRCPQKVPTLVILGGGNLTTEVLSDGAQLRIVEASKILKQRAQDGKKNWVVLTGGFTQETVSEAKVMRRQLFMETGESAGKHDFILEEKSLNTFQNASFVMEMVKANKLKKEIVLVTGAVHLPRAKASFEKAGFVVCAVSAGYADFVGNGFAGFRNASQTVAVLNEYFGFLGYRLKGWI